jgi:hypothetical protein
MIRPDQRNAVAEDVAHHGFTAAGAFLDLGPAAALTTSLSVAMDRPGL